MQNSRNLFVIRSKKPSDSCTVYDPASDRYRFNYSIFVGIAMGIAMGIFFVFLLVREWRYSRRARPDSN